MGLIIDYSSLLVGAPGIEPGCTRMSAWGSPRELDATKGNVVIVFGKYIFAVLCR